ncbi:MAG: tRNA pseudouridine(55) synthase TruB [Eubacteriales bacterium]|jgi:tRNA pseudouridine55 synthase
MISKFDIPFKSIRNGPDLTAGSGGGIVVLDKPGGLTSMDCVNYVRRLYRTQQVGHTGTLDPLATGVLVMLVGRAVKVCEYTSGERKRYLARLRLGIKTDSDDISGEIISSYDGDLPGICGVRAAAEKFLGEYDQIPPMYSAISHKGKRLYELAREGIEIERRPRRVEVYKISVNPTDSPSDFDIDILCSGGTYIRTLCGDIGEALGCGGTMVALRRTGAGSFGIDEADTIEALAAMTDEELKAKLKPVERVFDDLENIILPDFFGSLARHGNSIYLKKLSRYKNRGFAVGDRVRMSDKNGFFALGELRMRDNELVIKPIKAFWTSETQDGDTETKPANDKGDGQNE